jgi:hypothetical protein
MKLRFLRGGAIAYLRLSILLWVLLSLEADFIKRKIKIPSKQELLKLRS